MNLILEGEDREFFLRDDLFEGLLRAIDGAATDLVGPSERWSDSGASDSGARYLVRWEQPGERGSHVKPN